MAGLGRALHEVHEERLHAAQPLGHLEEAGAEALQDDGVPGLAMGLGLRREAPAS